MNGFLGGKIENLKYSVYRPIQKDHLITLGGKKIFVNNYHNHGISLEFLAAGLEVIALDIENNHVEAAYSSQHRWLGLQWHPEREIIDPLSRIEIDILIKNFINNKGAIDESYYTCSRSG